MFRTTHAVENTAVGVEAYGEETRRRTRMRARVIRDGTENNASGSFRNAAEKRFMMVYGTIGETFSGSSRRVMRAGSAAFVAMTLRGREAAAS